MAEKHTGSQNTASHITKQASQQPNNQTTDSTQQQSFFTSYYCLSQSNNFSYFMEPDSLLLFSKAHLKPLS